MRQKLKDFLPHWLIRILKCWENSWELIIYCKVLEFLQNEMFLFSPCTVSQNVFDILINFSISILWFCDSWKGTQLGGWQNCFHELHKKQNYYFNFSPNYNNHKCSKEFLRVKCSKFCQRILKRIDLFILITDISAYFCNNSWN